ncbi:MAG TPA: hypothetical protein VIH15_06395 [Casimicrobiaceae bacterium]
MPAQGGGTEDNGEEFTSIIELAHHYKEDVLVPTGLPLGDAYAIEGSAGSVLQYGYDTLGELGHVNVYHQPPAAPGAFGLPLGDYIEISRTSITVHGDAALLLHLRYAAQPNDERWEVLWSQAGDVVQVLGSTATIIPDNGEPARHVTPGPAAVLAIADAIREIPVAQIDAAGILPKGKVTIDNEFEGQVVSLTDAVKAQTAFGSPTGLPSSFAFVHVFHSGWLRSYTVDLDPQGNRRLFLAGAPPPTAAAEAAAPNVQAAQNVSVRGGPAVYERIVTTAGSTSLLHFHVGGTQMLLEDATGGSPSDLVGIAETVGTQQDEEAPAIAVGAPALLAGKVQVPVSTTGSGLQPYSGFSLHLRWTASVFTYDSFSSTGSIVTSPICLAKADADGGGVILSCSATGGTSTTNAGLLATVVLAPAASGCSPLHLFTYGGDDAGDSTTGTYTIDPDTEDPQPLPSIDGSADVSGHVC